MTRLEEMLLEWRDAQHAIDQMTLEERQASVLFTPEDSASQLM